MRVLVVEDKRKLADAIAEWVVVLDRNLPLLHGDDICRGLLDSGSSSPC